MRYVDVNVLVYWLGDDSEFGEEATQIIKRIEQGERAVTSTITPWLVHVILAGLGHGYTVEKMLPRLEGLTFLKMEPLQMQDYTLALKNMEKHGFDLEDSLHFTVAQRLGINEIYSNDGDFQNTPVKPLGFKRLSDPFLVRKSMGASGLKNLAEKHDDYLYGKKRKRGSS